jgi:hypothetical protein
VRVGLRDGRVTIECQEAPRGLVVEKLARESRFELSGEIDARPLTLGLRDQPFESAIATLLADLPYRAQWRFDERTRSYALARLEVGETALEAADGAASAASKKRRDMADALRKQMREKREKASAGEEQKAEIAARRDEQARSQADLVEQLRSSNPEMRLEAVEGLDPEASLAVLMEVLKADADPRVRAKAAEQGGQAEGFMACAGLLEALGDPEAAVVLQALESIEFTCDSTAAPLVAQRCASATDPVVQGRCAEAVDFLQ